MKTLAQLGQRLRQRLPPLKARNLLRTAAIGGAGVGISMCTNYALSEPSVGGSGLPGLIAAQMLRRSTCLFGFGEPSSKQQLENAKTLEVDHISAWMGNDYKEYDNPLKSRPYPLSQNFATRGERYLLPPPIEDPHKRVCERNWLIRAGPREKIAFNPKDVKAAVVTCGGLCPGLNTVIQGIVRSLHFTYGVPQDQIYGIPYGYGGMHGREWTNLDLEAVSNIHTLGGTILGSSRGGWDLEKMMNALEEKGINQLYVIGGDGTHRGAQKLAEEAKKRKLNLVVAGIPKTIDNDIPFLDQSFGYRTSVGEAIRAIKAADTEANGAPNCIGLVKVMGRHAGFIAMQASIAARCVNCCLIPEMDIDKEKFFKYMKHRMETKQHAVVVIAEGAGATLCSPEDSLGTDASGNPILPDVGLWLKDQIKKYMKKEGIKYNLKYIDPTYMIRSVPADADDQLLCTFLANHAVHGAMTGFTGFTVGQMNHKFMYIPIKEVTKKSRRVDVKSTMFCRMLLNTGQPDFTPYGHPYGLNSG